jgi:16S rRNA (cytosine967-C5)-methyltransferase
MIIIAVEKKLDVRHQTSANQTSDILKHFSHLNSAALIVAAYDGSQPFHLYIRQFFGQHKKYGSRDRKQITHCCYCYFRMGPSAKDRPVQEVMLEALFLCTTQPDAILAQLQPAWNEKPGAGTAEKCAVIGLPLSSLQVFPFPEALSTGIDTAAFNLSHLHQPDVFIRIRPGQLQAVQKKLSSAAIAFELINNHCISVPPSTKLDDLLQLNKEAVIQDYSSQQTGQYMQMVKDALGSGIQTWDCCAASGGKSILAKDILGDINLTVTDIRPAVLVNLKKRFAEAGIRQYKILQEDLGQEKANAAVPPHYQFIIADVPCSGSGTWGRTPERLSFFKQEEIEQYSQLQKKIAGRVVKALAPGGYFLYITCSVFKAENEALVEFIAITHGLQLVKMELLKGYTAKADTMFVALLQKPL